MGDITATIRVMSDLQAAESREAVFPADLSGLNSSVREISITIPASNLKITHQPSLHPDTTSPRNYSGTILALDNSVGSTLGRYIWGTPMLQSIYSIFDYDRGVLHMAQASFKKIDNPEVESLDVPFEDTWYVNSTQDSDVSPKSPPTSPPETPSESPTSKNRKLPAIIGGSVGEGV